MNTNDKIENLNIEIGNTTIIRVKTFKYLGLYIDENLTFSGKIKYIIKRTSSAVGALFRAKYVLTLKHRIRVYNSLINPIISYCIIIWSLKQILT